MNGGLCPVDHSLSGEEGSRGVRGQFFKLSHISVSLPKTSTLLQHDSKPKTVSFLLQDPSKIPSWLKINKIYYPDFIVPDPKVST